MNLVDITRDYPEAAHCDALYEVRDDATGLHAFIALHDLSRGAGYGGVRRRQYPSVRAAVHEVVGLAEQMTLKTAFANLPAGGAKAVIIDRPGLDLERVYETLGKAIETLDGAFFAGPDVGTSETELAALRHTAHFVTRTEAFPARSAATGVVLACQEALRSIDGATGPLVVAGVGAVGSLVARGLAGAGYTLRLSDIDDARAQALANELHASVLAPDDALYGVASLLAPCAIGPVITAANIARFNVKIVCGSANQQLDDETLAHALDERGILYVPDFAVNAGAVIEGVLRQQYGDAADIDARVQARIEAIGPRIRALLEAARKADVTPLEAALMELG